MKDKLKIGLFSDTYVPQINGVVTVLQTLRRLLDELGHEVFIFAPTYADAKPEANVYRFASFTYPFHKESRVVIPYKRKTSAVFEALDVVHSHTPFSLGLLALWVARRYKKPHLHTYHTLFTEYRHYVPPPFRPTRGMAERISAAFCNRCDAVTAPSQKMRDELLRYGVKQKIFLLPFGPDLSEFKREPLWEPCRALKISPRTRVLLFAGRLGTEKNLLFLLRAFKRMSESKRDLCLVIAGDGPQRQELEEYATALGVRDQVLFTGYLEHAELIDLYKVADLFVFASKTETQGLVLVEALAAGTPIVAVGAMGVLDIVTDGENGLLADEDEEAFARAAIELLDDPEKLHAMKAKALKRAYELSAQGAVQKLIGIYRELCEVP